MGGRGGEEAATGGLRMIRGGRGAANSRACRQSSECYREKKVQAQAGSVYDPVPPLPVTSFSSSVHDPVPPPPPHLLLQFCA